MTQRWLIKMSQPRWSKPETTRPRRGEFYQAQPKNVQQPRAWMTRNWPSKLPPSSVVTTELKPTPPSEARATSLSFQENLAGVPWATCRRARRRAGASIHEASVSNRWMNTISSPTSRRRKEVLEKMTVWWPMESETCQRRGESRIPNLQSWTWWQRTRSFRP